MLSVLVQYLPRGFCNLRDDRSQTAGLKHAQFFVIQNGGLTLHFSRKCKSFRCISSHGRLTESPFDENKTFNKGGEGGRAGALGICFCKNDKISEGNGIEKGLEALDWSILNRWDVPWDWITILFTMNACGLSFLLTGLAESAAISYLEIPQRSLMNLDEQATLLFIDRFLTTTAGLATIFAFVSRYKPLPDDLFCYRWKEPFSLHSGWLLWGGFGLVTASIVVAILGVVITTLNGKPSQREMDALLHLLPMIGASKISTTCLIGVTGILAPLFEETMFRGFLMTSLTKWETTSAVCGKDLASTFLKLCIFVSCLVTNTSGCVNKCLCVCLRTPYPRRISSDFCIGDSVGVCICSNSKSSYPNHYTCILELRSNCILDIPSNSRV